MFDYCIIDEAGQLTLPVCLGPIIMAKTFILVGDHFQLPPLVKSPVAACKGMSISLFRFLSEKSSTTAMTFLSQQYRMNEAINWLANKMVYRNMLQCGNEEVAKRKLADAIDERLKVWTFVNYPYPFASVSIKGAAMTGSWIRSCLSGKSPLLWLNTDGLGANLEQRRNLIPINPVEIDIITLVIIIF